MLSDVLLASLSFKFLMVKSGDLSAYSLTVEPCDNLN